MSWNTQLIINMKHMSEPNTSTSIYEKWHGCVAANEMRMVFQQAKEQRCPSQDLQRATSVPEAREHG